MKDKPFDCVEMMHRGQAEVKSRLAGLSRQEQLAYWQQRSEELRQKQERIRASRLTGTRE